MATPLTDAIRADAAKAQLEFNAYADALMSDVSGSFDLVALLEELRQAKGRGLSNDALLRAVRKA